MDRYVARGWGWRHFVVGASGAGKSIWLRRLIAYALSARGNSKWALVYDCKDPTPTYEGLVRSSVSDFHARPPSAGDPRTIVIHQPSRNAGPSAVATEVQRIGAALACFDELYPHAVSEGGQRWLEGENSPIPNLLRTGRSARSSIAVGTQMPQNTPGTLALCETKAYFRCVDRAYSYLVEDKRLPRAALEILPRLPTGVFLLTTEEGWDGYLYGPG